MKRNKSIPLTDELVAEQKIVGNLGIMRTIYKFKNNKAISCINTNEFYNEEFAKVAYPAHESLKYMSKNEKFDGKILEYEWSDEFFKEKGEGESKEIIEKWLKSMGWKIKKSK